MGCPEGSEAVGADADAAVGVADVLSAGA